MYRQFRRRYKIQGQAGRRQSKGRQNFRRFRCKARRGPRDRVQNSQVGKEERRAEAVTEEEAREVVMGEIKMRTATAEGTRVARDMELIVTGQGHRVETVTARDPREAVTGEGIRALRIMESAAAEIVTVQKPQAIPEIVTEEEAREARAMVETAIAEEAREARATAETVTEEETREVRATAETVTGEEAREAKAMVETATEEEAREARATVETATEEEAREARVTAETATGEEVRVHMEPAVAERRVRVREMHPPKVLILPFRQSPAAVKIRIIIGTTDMTRRM